MGDTFKLQRFYHTVINAKDLQRSVDFYVELGFEILHDRRDLPWPKELAPLFGLDAAEGGGVLLIVPSDDGGTPTMLDIIQWRVPLAEFPDRAKRGTTVPRILALKVDDVLAAHKELTAKGYEFTPAGIYTPPSTSMIVHSAHLYDPDGNIVELIQLKPGARHSLDRKE